MPTAAQLETLQIDRDAKRRDQRLERLEILCAAFNDGPGADLGMMIAVAEELEWDRFVRLTEVGDMIPR